MATPSRREAIPRSTPMLPQAHPSHLFPLVRAFGLDPTSPSHCRYLQLGCGDGSHLIACALVLPVAVFVGVDKDAEAIADGQRMVEEIGLRNVSLYAADPLTWESTEGNFDYVIAHNLYSRIPPSQRDTLLSQISRWMSWDNSVAFVSYDTYPGGHIRRMIRDMLRFHIEDISEPTQRVAQAREMLKFLLAGLPDRHELAYGFLAQEVEQLLNHIPPEVLYHDDLIEIYEPVSFFDFAEHARHHNLRFVAEAEPSVMSPIAFREEVSQMLIAISKQDVLMKEQYMDFLRFRRYRQTLLTKDRRTPQSDPDALAIVRMWLSGQPKLAETRLDLSPHVTQTFTGPRGAAAKTDQPLVKAALAHLAEIWPQRIAFTDLLSHAANRLGHTTTPEENGLLAHMLTLLWLSGMVEVHGQAPSYCRSVSERPVASPLARIQARTGKHVTTLLHTTLTLDDPATQRLVTLLDGQHTIDDVTQQLLEMIPESQRPTPAMLRNRVTQAIEQFADNGLLTG